MVPNPAQSMVNIKVPNTAVAQINIHNMLGQLVMNHEGSGQQEISLDVTSLTAGIYLVTVNGNTSKKLVIQ